MKIKKILLLPSFMIFSILLLVWLVSIYFKIELLKIFSIVFTFLFGLFLFFRLMFFLLERSFLKEFLFTPFRNFKRKFFFKIKNKFLILFFLSTVIPTIIFGLLFYFVIYLSSGFLSSHIFQMEVERVEYNLSLLNLNLEKEILIKNIESEDDFLIFLHKFLREYDFENAGIFSIFYKTEKGKMKIIYTSDEFLGKLFGSIEFPEWYLKKNRKGIFFIRTLPVILFHSTLNIKGKRFYLDSFIPITEGFVGSISRDSSIYFQPVLIDSRNNFYINDGKNLFKLKKISGERLKKNVDSFSHGGALDLKFSFFRLIYGKDIETNKETSKIGDKKCLVFISGYLSDVLKVLFSYQLKFFVYIIFFIFSFLLIIAVFSVSKGISLARDLTRSFDKLYMGTLEIQKGNFDFRVDETGYDQLAQLSKSFNLMAENISKLLQEVSENEKLKREIELARDVQKKFFPKRFPDIKDLDIYGMCLPAEVVSGDFYNFFMGERRVDFFVGDISGKGFPSSLLMASVNSVLLGQPYGNESLFRLIRRLNKFLYQITAPQRYSTLFYLRYPLSGDLIEFVNCGHNPPLLLRGDKFISLVKGSTILGMFEEIEIEVGKIEFKTGDIIFIYTDGLLESTNDRGEEFGIERLKETLLKYRERESREIVEKTFDEVKQFHSGKLEDDQTVLVIKRK